MLPEVVHANGMRVQQLDSDGTQRSPLSDGE